MIIRYILFILLLFPAISRSQCISGNCENGKGVFQYDNGNKYDGAWKDGVYNGSGVMYYSDGDKYEGNFVDGNKDGNGTYFSANGKKYIGDWKNDTRSGLGKEFYLDTLIYEGNWVNGAKEGKGKYYYVGGAYYIGDYKNNFENGKGILIWPDSSKYDGEFKNGFRNGKGTYIFAVGDRYIGNWKNNLFDGQGTYIYKSGEKYTGEWKSGRKDGVGTYNFLTGEKYTGKYKDDLEDGEGIWYYKDGTTTTGIWEKGRYIKNLESVEGSETTKVWVVIVGISKYNHANSLIYTKDDAYRYWAFLKSPEGGALPDKQLKILIDDDAVKENIIKSIDQIFGQAGNKDLIIFYFAGHGTNDAFLPYDYDGVKNKLLHTEMIDMLKKSNAKYKLCIIDACHSGGMELAQRSAETDAIKKYYETLTKAGGGTAFIMSSKAQETSGEFSGLRQGIFSYFLIKGLKGEADANRDEIISLQEIFNYVQDKVRDFTQYNQTPLIDGNFDPNMPVGVVFKR